MKILPYLEVILYSLVNMDYPVWLKVKRHKMHDAPYIKLVPASTIPGTIDVPVLVASWVGTSKKLP